MKRDDINTEEHLEKHKIALHNDVKIEPRAHTHWAPDTTQKFVLYHADKTEREVV